MTSSRSLHQGKSSSSATEGAPLGDEPFGAGCGKSSSSSSLMYAAFENGISSHSRNVSIKLSKRSIAYLCAFASSGESSTWANLLSGCAGSSVSTSVVRTYCRISFARQWQSKTLTFVPVLGVPISWYKGRKWALGGKEVGLFIRLLLPSFECEYKFTPTRANSQDFSINDLTRQCNAVIIVA